MHKNNIDTPYYEHLRSLDEERLDGWNRYLSEVQSMSIAKKVRLAKHMLKEVPGDPTFDGHYVTTGKSKLNLYLKFRVSRLTFKLPRKTKKRVTKALRLNGMSYTDLCFMERHSRHVIVRKEMDRLIDEAYNNAQEALLVEMDREILAMCSKAAGESLSRGLDREALEELKAKISASNAAFHFENDITAGHLEQEDAASDV